MVDQEQQKPGVERRDDDVVGKPTGDRIVGTPAGDYVLVTGDRIGRVAIEEDRILVVSESKARDRLINPSKYEGERYSEVRVLPDSAFDIAPENFDAPNQDARDVQPISDGAWKKLVNASLFLGVDRQRPERPEPSKPKQGEDVGHEWKTPDAPEKHRDPNARSGRGPE